MSVFVEGCSLFGEYINALLMKFKKEQRQKISVKSIRSSFSFPYEFSVKIEKELVVIANQKAADTSL